MHKDPFDRMLVAQALVEATENDALTVVGGGDSAAAA